MLMKFTALKEMQLLITAVLLCHHFRCVVKGTLVDLYGADPENLDFEMAQ